MHFICYASSVIWPGRGRKGRDFLLLSDLSHAVIEANNQTKNIRVMIFIGSVKKYAPRNGAPVLWLLNIFFHKADIVFYCNFNSGEP